MASDNAKKAGTPTGAVDTAHGEAPVAAAEASGRPFGPDAAAIEEFQIVLAMNRLRHAYLEIAPGLEPYLTTGHHDDERGLVTTYMLQRPTQARLWLHFLVNTPTIVATVDAALVTAIVVLLVQAADAPNAAVVAAGVAAFLAVWGTLFPLQRYTLRPLTDTTPRFPTPPDAPTVT